MYSITCRMYTWKISVLFAHRFSRHLMLVVAFAKLYQWNLILVHMVKLNILSTCYIRLIRNLLKHDFILVSFFQGFELYGLPFYVCVLLCFAFPIYVVFSFHNKGLKEGQGIFWSIKMYIPYEPNKLQKVSVVNSEGLRTVLLRGIFEPKRRMEKIS